MQRAARALKAARTSFPAGSACVRGPTARGNSLKSARTTATTVDPPTSTTHACCARQGERRRIGLSRAGMGERQRAHATCGLCGFVSRDGMAKHDARNCTMAVVQCRCVIGPGHDLHVGLTGCDGRECWRRAAGASPPRCDLCLLEGHVAMTIRYEALFEKVWTHTPISLLRWSGRQLLCFGRAVCPSSHIASHFVPLVNALAPFWLRLSVVLIFLCRLLSKDL